MKRLLLLLGITGALLCLDAKGSITVLDQVQTSNDGFAPLVYQPRTLAQTFTSGFTGSLVELELYLGGTGTQTAQLTVQITSTLGLNTPDTGNVLWSTSYNPLAGSTGWFSINTSAGAPSLVSGQQYAIVLTSSDPTVGAPDNTFLGNQLSNSYAGGALLENRGSGWTSVTVGPSYDLQPNADLMFRTHMEVIPEPSMGMLLMGSIGFILLVRRRY